MILRMLVSIMLLFTSFSLFAGEGSALIGWQTFSVGSNGNVNDQSPDTNSTYDDSPVGSISPNNHYLSGSLGSNASNAGRYGNGVATWNEILNGDNFGGGCGGNGEYIERWPLAGTNAIYEEVDITSASCQSGTTIVLDNAGHNFTLGDAIFVSGFVNDSFNGAKSISDTTSNSISFEKTCTSDPVFNTQACDGATYDGKVLVSNKIGDRIGPYLSNGAQAWQFKKNGTLDGGNDQGLSGDFSVTNNSDYYFRLEFIHFDARAGNNTCNQANRSPYLLDVIYLRDSSNLINKQAQQELDANKLMTRVNWGQCIISDGSAAPTPRKSVQNISTSVASAIESQAYLAPGDTAAFRFKFNTVGTFGQYGVAQIDNIAFEGTFFETAELQNSINPADTPTAVEEHVPFLPMLFQWILGIILFGVFALKKLLRS
jgi:hypothetical protein